MPQAPDFWYSHHYSLLAMLLWPLSILYGVFSTGQRWLRSLNVYYAGVPVISVGNISVGGSGKTPLVEALARYFASRSKAVAIVGCGYGAREARWPVKVDVENHTARQVGDEAYMLAQSLRQSSVAIWVAANKRDAVRRAEEAGAELIILDDGFHRADIARSADIVVIDGPRGFGNGLRLPAGPLREPRWALSRASFAVVMDEAPERNNQWYGATAYRLKLTPEAESLRALQGKSLVAFAGLGNPQKFFDTLEKAGLDVVEKIPFADHYNYRPRDLSELKKAAMEQGAVLVTTAKDAAKLPTGFTQIMNVVPTGKDWQVLLADLLPRLQN